MGHIFVSYSRRDQEIVDSFVGMMESAGISVWIDREKIQAGRLWRTQIVQAIDTCDGFVLLLSTNSVTSDNVRTEIDLAHDSGRSIFVILLEPVKLPAEMRYQLIGLQHINLQTLGLHKGANQLIETLNEQSTVTEERPIRQVELVIQGTDVGRFNDKKQAHLLDFLSELTKTPESQFKIANLAAGSVHVFIDMPELAAFALKSLALNRDRRLKKFGITSLRLVGDKKYVNIRLGILTTVATLGFLKLFWGRIPAAFPSLFGATVGKVIVITSVIIATTAVGAAVAYSVSPPTSTPAPVEPPISTLGNVSVPTLTDTLIPMSTDTPTSTATDTLSPTPPSTATSRPTLTPTRIPTLTPTYTRPVPTKPFFEKKPDLYISEFSLNPSTPTEGSPVSVHVGVYNQGTGNARPFTVKWLPVENYTVPGCSWRVDGLAAGEGRSLDCTYNGYPSWYGSINTEVDADSESEVAEGVEDNNTQRMAISVSQSSTIRVVFDSYPDGTPITSDRFLQGDEFLSQGIRLAGAPESSYCADGTATAIRSPNTNGGVTFYFLTTASPGQIDRCNSIPVAIIFTEPVRQVTLTFAGASVTYTMKAYDSSGSLLGTAQQDAIFNGGTFEVTFNAGSPNISRITFGHEYAVTAIKEITYER